MRNQKAIVTRKRRSVVLAGLLVLVMLLTGTWAWQSFNQQAFSPAYGRSNNGGRLHNDYDGYDVGTHNKDVYAENFGDNELFVRVQLREYLSLGGTPVGGTVENPVDINNPSTWPIFNSAADNVTTRRAGTDAALIGAEGIEWEFGGSKIFMPTFNQVAHEAVSIDPSVPGMYQHLNAYRMTNATGVAVDAIAGAFDVGTITSVQDMIAGGVQTGPGTTAGEPSVGSGGQNDWENGATFEAPVLRVDDARRLYLTPPQTHTAQSTLTPSPVNHNGVNVTNGVMTLTQWQAAGRPMGNFWILDTENPGGWFYWAMPLQPEQATSLLLDQLTINEQRQDWEYIVTPMADFVTRGSINTLSNLSADAREIWERGTMRIDLSANGDLLASGSALSIERGGPNVTIVPSLVLVEVDGAEKILRNETFEWEIQETTTDSTVTNGVINIGASETHDTLTLLVTEATYNLAREMTIKVTSERGLGLPAAAVGCAQTGTPANLWTDSTGVEWCVVETSGDYSMLVSRRTHQLPAQDGLTAHQANLNHSTNTFVSWSATTAGTGGPAIRRRVNTWFNNNANVSPELRNSAVHATLPNLNNALTDGAWNDRNSDLTALSQPVTGTSNGLPFFLSPADLNVRLGHSNVNRQALAPDGTTTRWYWLRSTGINSHDRVSIVNDNGSWSASNAGTVSVPIDEHFTHGVRPAIWVRR